MVERLPYKQDATGSNPVTPIQIEQKIKAVPLGAAFFSIQIYLDPRSPTSLGILPYHLNCPLRSRGSFSHHTMNAKTE